MSRKKSENFEGQCSVVEGVDPRVRRTRQLLQEALRSLLREKRFSAISVQDIAERATVNRATFYAHYVDKEDLANSSMKAHLHTAIFQRFPTPPVLTRENLVEMAVVIFEFVGNFYEACPETAIELQDTAATTLQQCLYEIIEGWLPPNAFYPRLFPNCSKETIATVLSCSIYGGATRWSRSVPRSPAISVCREIVSILLPEPSLLSERSKVPVF